MLEFPSYCGKVFLRPVDDVMTPYGGLVPFAAFQKQSGLLEALSESSPITRSSPNATRVYDILCSFGLTVLCDGSRFTHANRIREDRALAELFGMNRVPGDDTIRRFLYSLDIDKAKTWINNSTRAIWNALPERFIIDWDSTVQTKYGHQEGAEVGYNPSKRGRKSFHPLLATVGGTRLCLYYRWRSGKESTASEWIEAMEECLDRIGTRSKELWLNRGDIGFGSEKIMNWHETEGRPNYLFKLKLTQNIRRAIARIPESQWQGNSAFGVLQTAEATAKLTGWSNSRRIVVGRRNLGIIPSAENQTFWDETKYEFEAYVTDLSIDDANSWQIVDLYRKRADCENVFDELKNQWGFNGFCCKKSSPTIIAAMLLLLFYNMWTLFIKLISPEKHIEMISGRKWFLLIAARLVKSGRQKELHISVGEQWWKDLKDGYSRICEWINLTAPQLNMFTWYQPMLL
jgi:hypothetical protein